MFCPHCQRPNADTSVTCQYCGNAMRMQPPQPAAPSAVPPVVIPQTPGYVPPASVPPVYQPQPEHPVLRVVKDVASSAPFLVAVIAFTAAVLLNLLSTFSLSSTMSDLFSTALDDVFTEEGDDLYGWDEDIYNYEGGYYDEYGFDDDTYFGDYDEDAYYEDAIVSELLDSMMTGSMVASVLPGVIMSGLVVTALWLVYAAGKNRRHPGMNTTGLTILSVMSIIQLVGIGLIALLFLLVLLLAMIGVSAAGEGTAVAIMAVVLVVIALILAFAIFYQAKVLQSIRTVKKTILSGVPSDKVSLFVAVMCFIAGGSGALSALFMIVLDAFAMLGAVAQAVSMFAFGLVILQYRNRMRELMFYAAPQAGVPAQAAQNYYEAPAPVMSDYSVPAPGYADPPAPPQTMPPAEQPTSVNDIPAETEE